MLVANFYMLLVALIVTYLQVFTILMSSTYFYIRPSRDLGLSIYSIMVFQGSEGNLEPSDNFL